MGKVVYVAMLWVMAGCGLLLGAGAAYERLLFWWDGKDAEMVCHDPRLERAVRLQIFDSMLANVEYISADGTVAVPDKFLSEALVRRLGTGQSVKIRYLVSDPTEIVVGGQSLPNPWGWLIVGVVAAFFARLATKLLRRELTGA